MFRNHTKSEFFPPLSGLLVGQFLLPYLERSPDTTKLIPKSRRKRIGSYAKKPTFSRNSPIELWFTKISQNSFKDKQEDNENDQLKKDADNDLKNAKKCWGKW